MFYILETIMFVLGVLALCYFVVWYGLSGRLKKHMDMIFKRKKKDDVNSGAKYG